MLYNDNNWMEDIAIAKDFLEKEVGDSERKIGLQYGVSAALKIQEKIVLTKQQ